MAGIEKVCEYSGDYPGYLMYGYKRNHIQICPEYRKEFRGQHATLIFFKPDDRYVNWRISKSCIASRRYYGDDDQDELFKHGRKWYRWVCDTKRRNGWMIAKPVSVVVQYEYVLIVPSLPGNVEGQYFNHTCSKGDTIRRLKRLVGSKYLTIENSNLTVDEYLDL